MDARFGHANYQLRKRVLSLFGHKLWIMDPAGNVAFFVRRKMLTLREDIRIYADESTMEELLCIKARQIVDFSAAYDVVDSKSGKKLGAFKRKGWSSVIRDKWIVMDEQDTEIGEVLEDSMGKALLRRFFSNLIPQAFHMTIRGAEVAKITQRFNPFVLKLDAAFAPGMERAIPKGMGIAGAVLLALIEGRQKG